MKQASKKHFPQDLSECETELAASYPERELASPGRQIDRLAYQLYGLKGKEMKIVEGN